MLIVKGYKRGLMEPQGLYSDVYIFIYMLRSSIVIFCFLNRMKMFDIFLLVFNPSGWGRKLCVNFPEKFGKIAPRAVFVMIKYLVYIGNFYLGNP